MVTIQLIIYQFSMKVKKSEILNYLVNSKCD
jgi:hypothetical protein